MAELDLSAPRRIHIVGIGGAGMSAIATVLAGTGHTVSGSDLKETKTLVRLRLVGVDARVGHAADHLPEALDAVVVSSAIGAGNPEVDAARARGVAVLPRAAALAALVATRRGVAVAGSHGKTTTASMLALILRAAGWRPSFVIGGDLNEVGTNAAHDTGEWLVVEADESDGTFLELAPEAAIVTNVEADHLEHYGDFTALTRAFEEFLAGVPGPRVACGDDPVLGAIAGQVAGIATYGEGVACRYRLVDYEPARTGSSFSVLRGDDDRDGAGAGAAELLGAIELPVPGRHNALNALGAAATALELGAPFEAIVTALRGFGGVARRFQFRGEVDGVTIVDDYAHLPSEVAAAIATARDGGWSPVVTVFQPHRYSRTERLWQDFGDAFAGTDALVLTDVYSAGETPRPGVSGRLILQAVLDAHPALPVRYLPRRTDLVDHVLGLARAGGMILTLGAGDVTTLADEWTAGTRG